MNPGPNPEMTELAMMTNVPAGRTGGSVIPHCHRDDRGHVTELYDDHAAAFVAFSFTAANY